MRLRLRYIGLAAACAAGFLTSSKTALASCVTCTSQQSCAPGHDGAYCGLYLVEGQWWCNWYDACTVGLLTPQDLAPSGTYLLAEATVVKEGREVVPCNGYVVGHTAAAATDDALGEIRI